MDLFRRSKIMVGREEWEYAASPDPGDTSIPWLVREGLKRLDLEIIQGEGGIAPGVSYFHAPGHTPGCYAVSLETGNGTVVLAGDALKYYREIVTGVSDMPFGSMEDSARSIWRITSTADRIVPGHFPELVKAGSRFVWERGAAFNLLVR